MGRQARYGMKQQATVALYELESKRTLVGVDDEEQQCLGGHYLQSGSCFEA